MRQPIETAPKDQVIDIWVEGPGARWVRGCRWGKPSQANWGDRYGDDQNMPPQWMTTNGFALDRRNGVATHWGPAKTRDEIEIEGIMERTMKPIDTDRPQSSWRDNILIGGFLVGIPLLGCALAVYFKQPYWLLLLAPWITLMEGAFVVIPLAVWVVFFLIDR